MIPQKFRKEIDKDERFKYCFITGSTDTPGRPIHIHHAIFGTGRPDEMWNYVPLRIDLHEIGPQAVHDGNKMKWGKGTMDTREVCELCALLRAPNEHIVKYNLVNKYKFLLSKKDLVECVETLMERWDEMVDPII